jgi:hypothetical protein
MTGMERVPFRGVEDDGKIFITVLTEGWNMVLSFGFVLVQIRE